VKTNKTLENQHFPEHSDLCNSPSKSVLWAFSVDLFVLALALIPNQKSRLLLGILNFIYRHCLVIEVS
jgi:hypothetical protein